MSNVRPNGFSLIELLVATAVCALLSAAIAGVVMPARAAFETTPAAIDLHQRGRTGVDVLVTALRSAGATAPVMVLSPATGDPDRFEALYVVSPVVHAAQGVLDRDQPGPDGALSLAAGPGCPAVDDVCGFTPGAVAIVHGTGRFDVFTVASASRPGMELVSDAALGAAYPAGSQVIEVEAGLFYLLDQSDGSRSLVRETAGGAVQPIVDHVTGLGIEAWGGRPLQRYGGADFDDGPWLAGGPDGAYDADFRALRRIDFWIRVEATPPMLRSPAGQSALRWVPERTWQASVTLRNAP